MAHGLEPYHSDPFVVIMFEVLHQQNDVAVRLRCHNLGSSGRNCQHFTFHFASKHTNISSPTKTTLMAFPKTFRVYQYENYGSLEKELKIHDNIPQKPLGPEKCASRYAAPR